MKAKFLTILACLTFVAIAFNTPTVSADQGIACTYTYSVEVTNHPDGYTVEVNVILEFDDAIFSSYALSNGAPEIQPGETGSVTHQHTSLTAPIRYEYLGGGSEYLNIVENFDADCDEGEEGEEETPVIVTPRPEFAEMPSVGRVVRSLRWGGEVAGFVVTNYNNPNVDALELSPDFLAELPQSPEANTEFAVSEDGLTRFYVLTTGEFQVNFGPDFEGKYHVIVFDRGFNINRTYTFN